MDTNTVKVGVYHSTLHAGELFDKVVPAYELPQPLSCELWWRGINHTYKVVTDEADYALRVYVKDWRTRSEIEFEVEALLHAHKNGASVSYPIPRKDGGYITEVEAPEGTRYIIVTTFAKGTFPDFSDPEDAFRYGQAVGRLHESCLDFSSEWERPGLWLDEILHHALDLVVPFVSHRPDDQVFLRGQETKLAAILDPVKDQLQTGLCHGDYYGPNAHMHDGTFTFFDFDFCGMGYLAYDLATFKAALKFRLVKLEVWDDFMKGYSSIRELPALDIEMIDVFTAVFLYCRNSRGVIQWNGKYVGTDLFNEDNINGALKAQKTMAKFLEEWEQGTKV